MEEEKPAYPEYEGDGRSTWWYVCSECHGTIDPGQEICPHCKRVVIWQ